MAVWLITGATGFVGRYVLDAVKAGVEGLARSETEVVALGRRCPLGWPERSFVAADLNDTASLRQAVQTISPDFVVHTAGRTPPALDEELYRANFWATIHLLGALRTVKKPLRVVLSGSAAELGPVDAANLPVNEGYALPARQPLWPKQVAGHERRAGRESSARRYWSLGSSTRSDRELPPLRPSDDLLIG